ncbi:MAG: hypothetical protein CMH57_06660 [Myxococcales bacterium]|nr:hypothetical protein [Myxococcales bacterium]
MYTHNAFNALAALLLGQLLLVGCGDDRDDDPSIAGQTELDAGDTTARDTSEQTDDSGEVQDTSMDDASIDAAPDTTPTPEQYTEPGPYGIGFQRHEMSYTPEGAQEPRTLRVVFWYPTTATDGELGQYADLLPREGVFLNAPVAVDEAAPVLVFTHGSSAIAEQSWFMAEFFATHGWIVVAMDHPGNTLFERDNGLGVGPFVELRPQDVVATIDYIDALPASEALSGLFSDARLVSGHSFGGYTALAVVGATYDVDNLDEACEALEPRSCDLIEEAAPRLRGGYGDPRLKAAIPMTPGGYLLFGEGLADVDVPVLLMTGARDTTLPEPEEGDPIWEALDGPDATRMVFLNAGHMTFSNLCEVVPNFAEDDGCGDSFLPPPDAHVIINAYSLAFARAHVLNDPQAMAWLQQGFLLDGEVEVFEK